MAATDADSPRPGVSLVKDTQLDEPTLRSLPKVLLHDHLDGGLRPTTLLELAAERGYRRIPTNDPDRLLDWLRGRGEGTVERVLWAYGHMVALMQTASAIERVAREAAEDLDRENVIYSELRLAPTGHTAGGLTPDEVIEAAVRGFRAGAGEGSQVRLILVAIRAAGDSNLVAELAIRHREIGVVGFDLAGPESGHGNADHLEAIERARAGGVAVSLHAGEERGVESILESVEVCGATRIGVAHRLIEDLSVLPDGSVDVGPSAAAIRAAGVHLEACPTAGLRMHGVAPEDHPVGAFHRAGFSVGLNTDSRLLYGGDLTAEYELVTRFHGFTIGDLRTVTMASVEAAFCDDGTRQAMRDRVERGFSIG